MSMTDSSIIANEIDFNIPFGLPGHEYPEGKPLFTAYGCVLFEKMTPKGFSYRACNLDSGRTVRIAYRKEQMEDSDFVKAAAKIRSLEIAGASRFIADRPPGESMQRGQAGELLERVFRELLPAHGYSVREPQAELARHIFDCLCRRNVTLAEAEVGVGKTLAYLTAAAIVKRGRVNDFWFRGASPGQNWADSAFLPVVVSTSSIALQNALVREYIPELSRILQAGGIINEPLTCVLRKGREHYLCEQRLRNYLADADEATAAVLVPLLERASSIDLADTEGLTPYMKRRVCVTGRCDYNCAHRERCRHRWHAKQVKSNAFDFQICNHQLLLADILHIRDGLAPLLPHHQAVIIDEGHKFLAAARQMYGVELAMADVMTVADEIHSLDTERNENGAKIWSLGKKLRGQARRLERRLCEAPQPDGADEEAERLSAVLDKDATRHLLNIRGICEGLLEALPEQRVSARHKSRRAHILWELAGIRKRAGELEKHGGLICWTEKRGADTALCSIPKDLDERLHKDFWNKGVPIVLTSGTLSAAGRFARIKRSLGLHRLPPHHLMQTSQPSPFDHYANTLVYISERVPFPNNLDRAYTDAVADEVGRLVRASNGHAAVLFTSYNAMGLVKPWLDELAARGVDFVSVDDGLGIPFSTDYFETFTEVMRLRALMADGK